MSSKFHYDLYLLKIIEKWVYYRWRSFFLGIEYGSTCCDVFGASGIDALSGTASTVAGRFLGPSRRACLEALSFGLDPLRFLASLGSGT